jgi:acyl-CoA synthetase (AMP-forming)/AMP-acid ligase II/thioesterase domain-containing protein/acyl carrier protein
MAFLLFGIMGGAIAVPISPRATAEELAIDFRQREIKTLVVEAALETPARSIAEQLGIPIIEAAPAASGGVDGVDFSGGAPDRSHDPAPSRAEDYFVVLLTSGTTERSKVVPIRHRHRITGADFGHPTDRILAAGPLYFAGRQMAVVRNLTSGASTILAPSFDMDDFWDFLGNYGLTQFTANPTILKTILSQASAHATDIERSNLQLITASGSKVEPEIADEIEELFGVPVVERYAASEANRIAGHPFPRELRKRGSVGIPVDCEVRIRSLDGNFLPTGERGEVVVRGPHVFDGYENDDAANAEAFADGWFRTGDEGFFDNDGYLTLTGRIKEVINRGGEKVSPAEVDSALTDHPYVHDAATFPIPHPTLGEEVAAAVVKTPGSDLAERELTYFLLDRLSGAKVPRCIVFTDEIPKSDAGKVQRHQLAEAFGVSIDSKGHKSSRNPSPLEYRLLMLWRWTLKNPRVGIDDNFFLMGGDSLQAVGLFLQLEKVFKCRLPVATLFKAGTVAEMAELLQDMEPQGAMVPFQAEGDRPPFFCVHAQTGQAIFLYQLSQHLDTDQPLYGIQSLGWDQHNVPFTKAQDMAEHYVAEIRKIQPVGPYYIGGYSFGGKIAVYMANIFKEAGDKVAFLGLFDTLSLAGEQLIPLGLWLERLGGPTGAKKVKAVLSHTWYRLIYKLNKALDRALRMVLFPVLEYYRASGRPLPPAFCRPDRCNRLMQFELRNMPTYDGDAIYFKAETARKSMSHPDTQDSWHQIIKGDIEYIPVTGAHLQMMTAPHVQHLAQKLTEVLARAREN